MYAPILKLEIAVGSTEAIALRLKGSNQWRQSGMFVDELRLTDAASAVAVALQDGDGR